MAMHLDFTERARDIHKLTKSHGGGNHSRVDAKVRMNAETVKFTEGFMYGGKGKNRPVSEVELCTEKQSSHFAGSDNHDSKDTTSGTAAETRLSSQTRLSQPHIAATGEAITGANKNKMQAENRKRQRALQQADPGTQWTTHGSDRVLPPCADNKTRPPHRNAMCPAGLAMRHPAADTLLEWAQLGCPTKTGRLWTQADMEEAIARGPHQWALTLEAIEHFAQEIEEKVRTNQARVIEWDTIKASPPTELKVSLIAAIPHKSKAYWLILDLLFHLKLQSGGIRLAVNDTMTKTAPGGAIDQIGDCLSRIIHAFAEADDDATIFMAKWDIKDGFWRMDCREGKEWNFAYVLPQHEGQPVRLVIPTSLQMGWVELPPYYCAATETARDTALEYIKMRMGTKLRHKFEHFATGSADYAAVKRPQKEIQLINVL